MVHVVFTAIRLQFHIFTNITEEMELVAAYSASSLEHRLVQA